MKKYIDHVINQGDANGNEMTVRFRLPSGLEIFGLPTKNFYGGYWDLGPTWNYVIMADKPFLVDAGRFGQGKNLIGLVASVGLHAEDLEFVLISHGHEDHDGGVAELVKTTNLRIKAHAIYGLLIRKYPRAAPRGHKKEFPAKCWQCMMPESFYTKNCLGYHKVLQDLEVDVIGDGANAIAENVHTLHLAGHSPDCLAVLLDEEAIIVGDIILPDISPWPTREALFDDVAAVIKPEYTEARTVFGLRRYLKSLKKLGEIARLHPDILVLPAHRLYYNSKWNGIRLRDRVDELLQHHIQRCAAILEIVRSGAKTAAEIAREHFEESLLEGFGSIMAANEIISHCELLIKNNDVVILDGSKYAATGSTRFESDIKNLKPDY